MYLMFQALLSVQMVLPMADTDYENGMKLLQRVWVAQYDTDDCNKQLARRSAFNLKKG